MNTLLIYSPHTSARLKYVFDWLFTEQLGLNYILTPDATANAHISYGAVGIGSISIPDTGLLWQQGITKQTFATGAWNYIPTLYHDTTEDFSIPFDIFSAIFFLISRYEEYYSFTPDKHGRYPSTESILFKLTLERPFVDEWVTTFADLLVQKNIAVPQKEFSFTPTYDIDIAWSYKYKGMLRNTGGLFKDLLKGNFNHVVERLQTISGGTDPYDSFKCMHLVHLRNHLSPIYFMLVAQQTGPFDKNIDPTHPAMQSLIKELSGKAPVGVHPSYNSSKNTQLIATEKYILQQTTGKKISNSRQHYIKYSLPGTYRALIENNITDDYSMGYATHIGFRAGTGSSFLWYDILAESATALRLHPFCFMDTTAFFDMQLSVDESFKRLAQMTALLQRNNSTLITVFHNFSLGTDAQWSGWKNAYENFVSKL